ncbi:hypothetical protein [Nautilia sp.]|jgi:hypothetical protein
MTTFLIGQIMGVKQQTRNKSDGTSQTFTLVNVFNQLQDNEGFPVTVSENVQFPIDHYMTLMGYKGKFIAIPYTSLTTKNGNYIFPNADMQYLIFDKNPFDLAINKPK